MTGGRATVGAALLAAVLSWPLTSDLQPPLGLDGDWQIALQVALRRGLEFGPDVLFTYGPLGFLHRPLLVDAALARVAFAYTFAVHFGVCLAVVWRLRPALGSLALAALGALLVGAVVDDGATLVIGFAAAAALVAGLEGRPALLAAAGLGALAGLELQAKLNTGITLLALGAVALAFMPAARARLAGAMAGALAVALTVGWFATGQSLGAAGDYVTGGFEIVSGYSEAMPLVDEGLGSPLGEYVAALAIAALGVAAARSAGGALPTRGRAGLVVLWALLWFASFKAGFVRPDVEHVPIFFGTTLGGLAVLGWSSRRRRTPLLVGAALVALFAVLSVSFGRDGSGLPDGYFSPLQRAGNLVSQTGTLLEPGGTTEAIAEGRRARMADAEVPASVLAAARARPSHLDPFDAGLAWAYGLPWRPLPVFQTYSAYTPDLDARNARALRSPAGPAGVLRRDPGGVDGRNPDWESPAAMRALLCNFEARVGDARWQFAERVAPRCGRERPLGQVTVPLGRPAPVPAPPDRDSVVLARIDGIGVEGLERLRAAAFRAGTRSVVLDGGRRFRLVPGTAADGLILSVPPRADFPAPLGLDQSSRTLTVLRGEGEQPADEVRIRYSALPIRAPSRPLRASR